MLYKILMVDDDPSVIEALKRAFHREPYEILSANSAGEALEILKREPVAVIVSDEKMPGMQGTEFLEVACRTYPDTIRIMLTGHADLDLAIRAINEGQIYRFLKKPCDQQEILQTIRQGLQQKELAEKGRLLLHRVKEQNFILSRIEKDNPGITRIKRDSEGAIIVNDLGSDLDKLIQEMNKELEQ
jgi:two-component system, probable response regulator PhcQ